MFFYQSRRSGPVHPECPSCGPTAEEVTTCHLIRSLICHCSQALCQGPGAGWEDWIMLGGLPKSYSLLSLTTPCAADTVPNTQSITTPHLTIPMEVIISHHPISQRRKLRPRQVRQMAPVTGLVSKGAENPALPEPKLSLSPKGALRCPLQGAPLPELHEGLTLTLGVLLANLDRDNSCQDRL